MWFVFAFALLSTQTPPPQPAAPAPVYQKVEPAGLDVQAAVKFAFDAQKKKTGEALALAGIVTAERASVGPDNYRVCLFANRAGVTERAQVVVSRDSKKKKWDLQVWAWGSCR